MKDVTIYTWSYCPFCQKAKGLLEREGIAFTEHVIDGDQAAFDALKQKTGMGSVPQIFAGDHFIGGCDDLHALHGDKAAFNTLFGR